MKQILGLDLGPNSIGWAIVNEKYDGVMTEVAKHLEACGSGRIHMDAAIQGGFENG